MFTSNFVKHSTLAAGISSLIGLSSFFGASPSYGQNADPLVNPSFETGDFTGYETIGDTSIQTEDFGSGPTDGEFQALLSTLSGEENLPFDDFSFSGFGARPATALEAFLDVPDRTILPPDAVQGSAIRQMFTATPGDFISFDFNFLTDEDQDELSTSPNPFNDAFAALLGPVRNCRAFFILIYGDTSSVFDLSGTPFNQETGFNTFTQQLPFSPNGEYVIEFVVVDVLDEIFESGLLVDNIRFTEEPESDIIAVPGGPGDASSCSSCPPTSVPEPSSMLGLLAFGALGGRLVLKRQRKTLARSIR